MCQCPATLAAGLTQKVRCNYLSLSCPTASSSSFFRGESIGFDKSGGGGICPRLWHSPCRCLAESEATFPENGAANLPGANPPASSSLRYRSKLELLYHTDTSIPEEKIEKPRGLKTRQARAIGNKPPCQCCRSIGMQECATCHATGLYVEPILESQGVIVKVRCLGCGGSGTVMCGECGGRGHL